MRLISAALLIFLCACTHRLDGTSSTDALPEIRSVTAREMLDEVSRHKGHVVQISVWATWCGPCLAELPMIRKAADKYGAKGFDLLLVSTDPIKERRFVRQFLRDHGFLAPSFQVHQTEKAFVTGFSRDWSGTIPATFIYDRTGRLSDFWEGTQSEKDYLEKIAAYFD